MTISKLNELSTWERGERESAKNNYELTMVKYTLLAMLARLLTRHRAL